MFSSSLVFELMLIFFLIMLNGVFAMSEMAVVSARKPRLQQRAEEGEEGARRALRLAEHPTRFLSTVQVGITLIGVFAGAYGGASLASKLDTRLEQYPWLAPYSEGLALALVVAGITYLSLVLGELVPKRIALNHPERIAAAIAAPMNLLSTLAAPIVKLLSVSTESVLKLTGIRKNDEPPVTEEELTTMLEMGAAAGVFEAQETELVGRVFSLGDQQVGGLMTPRHRIEWLDINDPPAAHRAQLTEHRFSHYLVCDGSADDVLGMVRVKDLLAELLAGHELELQPALRKPLFVPATLRALRLLEMFRESKVHLAVVIDEYGGVEGLLTLTDILEEIVGELAVAGEPRVVQRADGSWLVDGSMAVDEFWELLQLPERRDERRGDYNTLGGLALSQLSRIPQSGDSFQVGGLRFEIVDMDGHRVDKLLVSRLTPEQA